jgi:hypothetical protein
MGKRGPPPMAPETQRLKGYPSKQKRPGSPEPPGKLPGPVAAERAALEYGEIESAPVFFSDEARGRAWEAWRDEIMSRWQTKALRPQGWWDFDADAHGVKYPADGDQESAVLWRAGQLTPEEVAMVETEWRKDFEQAQREPFRLTLGPNEILHGDEARRAHYADRGIPRELVRKWEAERKRAAKTIEALVSADADPPSS